MGDIRIVAEAMADLWTTSEIEIARRAALDASISRRQSVTITSANRRGDGTTGEITGSPDEILGICKLAKQIKDGSANGGPIYQSFACRITST